MYKIDFINVCGFYVDVCLVSSVLHRGRGVIVNISSGVACIPFPLYSLYAASKVSLSSLRLHTAVIRTCVHVSLFSGRCLWRGFLKVFKQNTKTKESSCRYSGV